MLRHINKLCEQVSGAVNVMFSMYIYYSPNKLFFLVQCQKVCKEQPNLTYQHEDSSCGLQELV